MQPDFKTRLTDFASKGKENKEHNLLRESVFFTSDHSDLSRSKISNLPNHKKQWMGDSLPVVVVLQGMEIDRLRLDNDQLSIKLKEFEHKIFNAQNYEVQIRELTQKLFEMERERESWSTQNGKLTMVCQQLYAQLQDWKRKYSDVDLSLKDKLANEQSRNSQLLQEIERWRARYMAMEKAKNKELDDLRLSMQSQRKSVLDREIRQLTVKFQGQRGILQAEIRKLRDLLETRSREIGEQTQRIHRLQLTLEESRRSQGTIQDLQNKLTMLSQEVLRLNEIVRNKQGELEVTRNKLAQMQKLASQHASLENENRQIHSQLSMRLKEIEQWKLACGRLEGQVLRFKEHAHRVEELQGKIRSQHAEYQRLGQTLRHKTEELESWRIRYQKMQSEMAKYRSMDSQLEDAQNKITLLSNEITRLNQVLLQRMNDLEHWKSRAAKLESSAVNLATLEEEYQKITNAYSGAQRTLEDMKIRLNASEGDKRKLEGKMTEMEQKLTLMLTENDRLNKVIRGKMGEVDDYKVKITRLQHSIQDYREIQVKLQNYEGKIVLLTQEIQRLNGILRTKISELEDSKARIASLEEQLRYYRPLESKMREYESRMQSMRRSNEGLQDELGRLTGQLQRAKVFQSRNQQLTHQVSQQSGQNARLNDALKKKYAECEEFASTIRRLEAETLRMREFEAQFGDLSRRYNSLSQELERLNSMMHSKESEWMRERDYFSGQLTSKGRESESLQSRIYQLQSIIEDYEGKVALLSQQLERVKSKIQALQNKNAQYSHQNQNLSSELAYYRSQWEKEQHILRGKNNELQEYRSKINHLECQLGERREEYQSKISKLSYEIERLNSVIRSKVSDYDALTGRLDSLQRKLQAESKENQRLRAFEASSEDLHNQISIYSQEIARLNEMLKGKTHENDEMRCRFSQVQAELLRYKESSDSSSMKIKSLSFEIERISKALREKDHQYQLECKNSNDLGAIIIKVSAQLERAMTGWNSQEQEYWSLNQRYHQLERSMGQWELERKNLKHSAGEWQSTAMSYQKEIERLQHSVSSYEVKMVEMQQYITIHSDCGQKIEILSAEVDRLTLENKSVRQDLENLRLRFSETLHIEKRHEEFCLSFVLMSAELEQMRGRMNEKEAQVQSMRKSMLQSARNHTHTHTYVGSTSISSMFNHH